MTPEQFKSWRLDMGWTHVMTADRLGISVSAVNDYQTGRTRHLVPKPVVIPKAIELACVALMLGYWSFPPRAHGIRELPPSTDGVEL